MDDTEQRAAASAEVEVDVANRPAPREAPSCLAVQDVDVVVGEAESDAAGHAVADPPVAVAVAVVADRAVAADRGALAADVAEVPQPAPRDHAVGVEGVVDAAVVAALAVVAEVVLAAAVALAAPPPAR